MKPALFPTWLLVYGLMMVWMPSGLDDLRLLRQEHEAQLPTPCRMKRAAAKALRKAINHRLRTSMRATALAEQAVSGS